MIWTNATRFIDAASQQLVFGSYNILYDPNGNVTNIISGTTTNRLLWSASNQLTNMLGAVTASFAYDGLGRRVTRAVSGNTEKYLYDGLDIISQLDGSSNVRGKYFRGLAIDEPWQRIDLTPAGGNKTTSTNAIYLADGLGSIVALTDPNRVITTEYDYEPFGATTTTGASNKNSYKFTAREDDGTGLYYYRARYYHPALGRFVSEDPIEFVVGDLDLYGYAENDPLNFVDPVGLDSIEIKLILGLGGKLKIGWNPDGTRFFDLQLGGGFAVGASYDPFEQGSEQIGKVFAQITAGEGLVFEHGELLARLGLYAGELRKCPNADLSAGFYGKFGGSGRLGPLSGEIAPELYGGIGGRGATGRAFPGVSANVGWSLGGDISATLGVAGGGIGPQRK